MAEITPMMKQYLEIKEQNKDSILFFRLGDFYEMFNEDAKLVSQELDLTLTTRDRNKPPEELYAYFCRALDQALAETARTIDPDTPREGMAGLALELALRSYADQLACQRILSILHPPEEKGKRRKDP